MFTCALAAVGFRNGDLACNKETVLRLMKQYASQADLIVFGEAFLQGLYALDFSFETDRLPAIDLRHPILQEIALAARENHIAVSFGFIEKEADTLYSSQITFSEEGEQIDLYRRVFPGWKEAFADHHCKEGSGFHAFSLRGRKIARGGAARFSQGRICGEVPAGEANVLLISI